MLLQPQHAAGGISQVSLICVAHYNTTGWYFTDGLAIIADCCLPLHPATSQQNCTKKIPPLVCQAQAAPAHARPSQACPEAQRMSCCATSQGAQVCLLLLLYSHALQLRAQHDAQPHRHPTCAINLFAAVLCSLQRLMLQRHTRTSPVHLLSL